MVPPAVSDFRHSGRLSRDIVGTSASVGGRPCRKRSSSSPRWCCRDAAKAKSPAIMRCRAPGSSNYVSGIGPKERRRSSRGRGVHTTVPRRSRPTGKNASSGCARPSTSKASTPVPPPSPATLPATQRPQKCLRCRRSGASSNGADSSHPNRTSGPARRGNASKPNSPTSYGKPMSPTGA